MIRIDRHRKNDMVPGNGSVYSVNLFMEQQMLCPIKKESVYYILKQPMEK